MERIRFVRSLKEKRTVKNSFLIQKNSWRNGQQRLYGLPDPFRYLTRFFQ